MVGHLYLEIYFSFRYTNLVEYEYLSYVLMVFFKLEGFLLLL